MHTFAESGTNTVGDTGAGLLHVERRKWARLCVGGLVLGFLFALIAMASAGWAAGHEHDEFDIDEAWSIGMWSFCFGGQASSERASKASERAIGVSRSVSHAAF